MDGYEMLDFFVNTFGCSSIEAFAYGMLFFGGYMGGFVFIMHIFMDAGLVLARLLCKFIRWAYQKFRAKRKEP